MPNLKLFNRRKSSGSALDNPPEASAPAQSSFRVIERPEKTISHTFDGRAPPNRPYNSPLQNLRNKSADNLGGGANRSVENIKSLDPNWALKRDRGSGGTTNSSSSGYYDSSAASARYSSSSTLPSSIDQEREREPEEELFQRKPAAKPMLPPISADAAGPLPPPPSLKSRAIRAVSFGQKHNRSNSIPQDAPLVPVIPNNGAPRSPEHATSPLRDRSLTTSSYASTTVPTKPQPQPSFSLGGAHFDDDDDDFGNMFDGIGKNKSRDDLSLPHPPTIGGFHRTVRLYPVASLCWSLCTC